MDTEGRIASDSFYVTYHGEPLNQSMVQLVTNALQVGLFRFAMSWGLRPCRRHTSHAQAAAADHHQVHSIALAAGSSGAPSASLRS